MHRVQRKTSRTRGRAAGAQRAAEANGTQPVAGTNGAQSANRAQSATDTQRAAGANGSSQVGPAASAEQMERDLAKLVATVQNRHLRQLLSRAFDADSEVWERFREAPAAKRYHQAYRHGLLEHTLTVAQAVGRIATTFPGIDRDLAVTGALLHDIGKLDSYAERDGEIEMTDEGRMCGEISLGYYRVRRLIEQLEDFPTELERALVHIILSHHGTLEHGSPVVPCTREATLVHMIDNLGGRLGSFDRLERELPAGARWSAFDKGIGAGAYFAAPRAA